MPPFVLLLWGIMTEALKTWALSFLYNMNAAMWLYTIMNFALFRAAENNKEN